MGDDVSAPVLLIDSAKESQQARELLERAGISVHVRSVPAYHPAAVAHGLPLLFGLSGRFEGLLGVEVFIQNARMLHRIQPHP